MENIEICEYDKQWKYDYDLTRYLGGLSETARREHGRWPALSADWDDYHRRTEILARVDGVIVGRARLEDLHHPYAELINIVVRPDYQGRGVGTALIRECITRARRLGFKVLDLQTSNENVRAHALYERLGLVRGRTGGMTRYVYPLDIPLASLFRLEHADAETVSRAAEDWGEGWWRLMWRAGEDSVSLLMRGGSCQLDCHGFRPVIGGAELSWGGLRAAFRVEAPGSVSRGDVAPLTAFLACEAGKVRAVAVRAVLLPEQEVHGAAAAAVPEACLEAETQAKVELPIKVTHRFPVDMGKLTSYPSVPFSIEILWGGMSIVLSAAVKVRW